MNIMDVHIPIMRKPNSGEAAVLSKWPTLCRLSVLSFAFGISAHSGIPLIVLVGFALTAIGPQLVLLCGKTGMPIPVVASPKRQTRALLDRERL